jgi:hypothetical protein
MAWNELVLIEEQQKVIVIMKFYIHTDPIFNHINKTPHSMCPSDGLKIGK